MAVSSLLKANPLLSSKRRQSFDVKFCRSSVRIRCADDIWARSNHKLGTAVKAKSRSLTRTPSNTAGRKDIAVHYYNFKAKQENIVSFNPILKLVIKWLTKTPVVVMVVVMTSLLHITMYGRQSAFALSGGGMGGDSFSLSSSNTSSSSSSSYRMNSYCRRRYPFDVPSKAEDVMTLVFFFTILLVFFYRIRYDSLQRRTKVAMLQVGLFVNGQSLQKTLNRIAKTRNSSTSDGWRLMLDETITSLLRHEKYWISGYSSAVMTSNQKEARIYFNRLSTQERMKFSEETLVNINNRTREGFISKEANHHQVSNTYMVVTILMAANKMSYESHLPTILDGEDVKKALDEIWHIGFNSEIQGLRVFWTPQRENEILSLNEFQKNYSSLKDFPTPACSSDC